MTAKRFMSIGANYIYAGDVFRLSYVVIGSCNCIISINPLDEEMPNTVFVNGVLLLLPQECVHTWSKVLPTIGQNHPVDYPELLALLQKKLPIKYLNGAEYLLWHLRLNPFSATELSTDDCCGYSNI